MDPWIENLLSVGFERSVGNELKAIRAALRYSRPANLIPDSGAAHDGENC
jgi:hypothetical protein